MPRFDSALYCLVVVQPIQAMHWHLQQLIICKGTGQHTSWVCHCIIYTQFHKWKSLHPIANTLMNKSINKLFDGAVLMFYLTVGLWVISTTKQCLHSEHVPQGTSEQCSKMHVMIVNQWFRNTMVSYPICKEQFCNFMHRQLVFHHLSLN